MEQEIGRLVEDSIHHGLGDVFCKKRLSTSACKYMRELAIQCFLGQLAKNVEMGLEGPNRSSTQRTTATSMDAFLVPQPADSDATEDAEERDEDGDTTDSGEAGDATAKAEHGAATEHARGHLSSPPCRSLSPSRSWISPSRRQRRQRRLRCSGVRGRENRSLAAQVKTMAGE
ncbi:MAG: hypothetical protein MK077_10725 [Phycisphaerales bacterium]|nr:hypothetical protein [Phycisphaerales bacterium]